MDNRQTAKMRMYDRCLGFYDDNAVVLSIFEPLDDEAAEAKADLVLLHKASEKVAPTKGITENIRALRTAMTDALLPLAQTATGYYLKKKDADKTELFDVHETDFTGGLDAAATLAQQVIDALTANLTELKAGVKIKSTDITPVQTAKDAFAGSIKNTATVQSGNETATGEIAGYFPKIDDHFAIMDRYMAGQFVKSQPALLAQWTLLREIGKTVRRHSGIHATIKNTAGDLLEGAQMTITETGRTAVSAVDGTAELSKMKAGAYHLMFKKGAAEKTLTVVVKLGVMTDVGVVL